MDLRVVVSISRSHVASVARKQRVVRVDVHLLLVLLLLLLLSSRVFSRQFRSVTLTLAVPTPLQFEPVQLVALRRRGRRRGLDRSAASRGRRRRRRRLLVNRRRRGRSFGARFTRLARPLLPPPPVRVPLRPHLVLFVAEILLLRAEDAAGARDPRPRDRLGRRQPEVLHQETADQRSGPTESRLAVDGHGAVGLLADRQELADDVVARGRAVGEEEIVVCQPGGRESRRVVQLAVESYHRPDVAPPDIHVQSVRGRATQSIGSRYDRHT